MIREERSKLIEKLNRLPSQQLDQVIFTLKPPKGVIPPSSAPQGDRTITLLSWAEGTGGCGLVAVQQALEKVLNGEDNNKDTNIPLQFHAAPPSSTYTTNMAGGQVGSVLNVNQVGTVIVRQPADNSSKTHTHTQAEPVRQEPAIEESHSITKYQFEERTAIKGLFPFAKKDAEIFAQMQRELELKECSDAITSEDFRFGVLSGESGNGKTSFLQAGLWPKLERTHQCVYVKFTDLDPLLTVKQTLVKQLLIPENNHDEMSLIELLKTVVSPNTRQSNPRPLILLLDQFEQFFVHQKRKKDREPFIQTLNEWYCHQPPLPIKIFISIRSDFADRLIELQKVMGYSLGPQQNFRLEKFRPEQAAEIFKVIAESEKLQFNSSFIEEITEQELARTKDGLISPIDIQILTWMIAGQSDNKNRAFNRRTFQKLGGVEGLLERFLQRALEARETPAWRQAAVKVLLALTDLDRNVRAGMLTLNDLFEKLNKTVAKTELNETVRWLARSDVRLIVTDNRGTDECYELAHERLIPALRRIAGKVIEPAYQTTLLLDRRVNEWIGNGRSKRYLFSLKELWLIRKQNPFIQWEPGRSNKEALISASWKQFRLYLTLVSMSVLLFVVGVCVWNSQRGQLQIIKWKLSELSKEVKDGSALEQIARAYAVMGDFSRATQLAKNIGAPAGKAYTLSDIAEVAAKVGNIEQAKQIADNIGDPFNKAYTLLRIAIAAAEAGNEEQAENLIKEAKQIADNLDPDDKARTLSDIAKGAAKVGNLHLAKEVIDIQETKLEKARTLGLILEIWARSKDARLDDISEIYVDEEDW
ncbi:MAG: hypothetical protein AB1489_39885 [Acidobacteriota bacterium]